jgi:hypothetical protein
MTILFVQEGSTVSHFHMHVAGWLSKQFSAIEAYGPTPSSGLMPKGFMREIICQEAYNCLS